MVRLLRFRPNARARKKARYSLRESGVWSKWRGDATLHGSSLPSGSSPRYPKSPASRHTGTGVSRLTHSRAKRRQWRMHRLEHVGASVYPSPPSGVGSAPGRAVTPGHRRWCSLHRRKPKRRQSKTFASIRKAVPQFTPLRAASMTRWRGNRIPCASLKRATYVLKSMASVAGSKSSKIGTPCRNCRKSAGDA